MPDMQQLSASAAVESLRSSTEGLTSSEVQRRLAEYGPNVVQELKVEPLWRRFVRELTQLLSLLLWFAAALAFLGEWLEPGQGMAKIGWAVVTIILVSASFSFWQEYRAERTLAALRQLLPQTVLARRDGVVIGIEAQGLVPGDVILLQPGQRVPADCRLLQAFGVRIDNSALTGESLPQRRDAQPSTAGDLSACRDILLTGALLVSGEATALVFATGMRTELGKIAHLTQTVGDVASPLRRELMHVSRLIAGLALIVGMAFFAVGSFIGVSFWKDFLFAIGIIVAMVPEGLLPTLTLALVLTAQRMAKRQVLVRYLPSLEALGSTSVICTDKTGTLTQNRMSVHCVLLGKELTAWTPEHTETHDLERYRSVFLTAGLCHDLKDGEKQNRSLAFGDPMEVALVQSAQEVLGPLPRWPRIDEVPFDTDRKRLSTIYETPEGTTLYCKGAVESLLPLCAGILVDGEVQQLDEDTRSCIVAAEEKLADQGLRVLALAHRTLAPTENQDDVERNLVYGGLVAFKDPARPEVPNAIRRCREAGVKVIMVTGDHPRTARAIAREVGLLQSAHPRIVTGDDLGHWSSAQLMVALDEPEIVFARVAAQQKLQIVQALKAKKHIVAVTGDGVNDAPALKSAHIGIAMGITGTEVAKEAADMVLLDDNFASIVHAIEEGRAVFENIRRFLTYVLVHNVAELVPFLCFALFGLPLALTPIQALAIDMGTDSLTALGLGVERPSPGAMSRPPRPREERLMNWSLVLRAYLFLGVLEAVAAMAAFLAVLYSGGWTHGQPLATDAALYLQATTACLSTIIALQIANVFLCRSASRSIFSTGVRGNKLILGGVAVEVVLLLAFNYVPWMNEIIGTAPVPSSIWLVIVPSMIFMLTLEEARKWIVRRQRPAPSPSR